MKDTAKKAGSLIELSLKDSELRYRRLFETAQDGILILDAKTGMIEDVNPYLIKMLGYSRAEFIKKKLWEVGSFKDIEASQEAFEALQENEYIRYEDLPLKAKDGRPIQVEFVSNVYLVGDEKVIQCNIRDITEHKRAEDTLRRNDILIRQSRDIILFMKLDNGRILEANEAALKAYGYTRDELLALTIGELRAPATRVLTSDQMAQANSAGILFETVHQRKDGSTFPVEVSSQGATVEGERELISVIRDITERKRAEEALRESDTRFRELFNHMSSGVAVYEAIDNGGDFIFRDFNPAAEKIEKVSKKDILGKRVTDVFPGVKTFGVFEVFQRVWQTGQPEYFPESIYKDERVLASWRESWVSKLPTGEIVAIYNDITERKQVEKALRESRERMAHLSRRLVEAQEEERRRIARELHDEVGQTLTALTISLEGISREITNDVMRDKIGGLQALTRSLITQVSALSTELRPRVLDDLGLIPGLIALFNRLSTQTGVEVDFKHTGLQQVRLTPEIEISAYRIIQEALTNVIRYAGVKTASVRLQVEGDILYIQVQDEGKGFDLQEALNSEGSLGLLSMTERAGQVGGHLEVQTAPGEGTLITCRLPLGSKHIERRQHERGENRPGR